MVSFVWTGMAEETNLVEKDVKVKLMKQHFSTTADYCWVPVNNILFSVEAPTIVNGIVYTLSENTSKKLLTID